MSQLYICNKANKYDVCKEINCIHRKPFLKYKGMMPFKECVVNGVTGKTVKIKDVKVKQDSL